MKPLPHWASKSFVGCAAWTSARLLPSSDLLGQRRELVVDDEGRILADREADVAARAGQHVHARRQRLCLDVDLREVLTLPGGVTRREDDRQRGQSDSVSCHRRCLPIAGLKACSAFDP
jgi:hypothetical protein